MVVNCRYQTEKLRNNIPKKVNVHLKEEEKTHTPFTLIIYFFMIISHLVHQIDEGECQGNAFDVVTDYIKNIGVIKRPCAQDLKCKNHYTREDIDQKQNFLPFSKAFSFTSYVILSHNPSQGFVFLCPDYLNHQNPFKDLSYNYQFAGYYDDTT